MLLRLTKNYVSLLLAGILDKISYVLLFAFLARKLPQEAFGAYSLILTLIFLGGILSNFGLEYVTIREVAKDHKEAARLFNNSLALGLGFSLAALIVVVALSRLLHYSEEVIRIIRSCGIIFVFMAAEQAAVALLKAFERMEIPAFVGMFNSVLLLLLSYLVLRAGVGVEGLTWVLVAVSGIRSLIYMIIVHRSFLKIEFRIDPRIMRRLLRFTVPFALIMVYGMLIRRTGILMIGWLKPLSEVAVYGAADKCLDFASLFGDSLAVALYPALASRLVNSREESWRLYKDSIDIFAILGFGGAVFMTIMAKPIMGFLFGKDYIVGMTTLIWLSWVFFLNVLSGPASILLLAAGDQMRRLLMMSLGVLFTNVVFNLILIPRYSYNGVAMAMLFSAFLGFLGRMLLTKVYFNRLPDMVEVSWRPLLASLMMGIVTFFLSQRNIFLVSIIAVMVYVAFLGMVGEFRREKYAIVRLKIKQTFERRR